jgi:ADP-heptose:LPS heptosyltransferase
MNGLEMTRRCIETVLTHSRDFELILTNNGATDGTGDYFNSLARDNSNIRVIYNPRNVGFRAAHNRALELSQGDYFVLLNNDCVVPEGWLESLTIPFNLSPLAALACPSGGCTHLDHEFKGNPGPMDYVEGACLMCRSEVVHKLGLFSDYLYFAYGEDSDLSLRCRRAGYSIHQVGFHVEHIRGATAKSIPLIPIIQEANHHTLRHKWGHYLKVRKMDYPIIVKRRAAIGDVLLTTPVIRALKKLNPRSPIHVWTDFPELFARNPYVASASKTRQALPEAKLINLDMAYENLPETHIVEAYSRAAGVEKVDRKLEIHPSNQDHIFAREHLKNKSLYVAIFPGPTTWAGKNWPVQNWNEVVRWIRGRGYKVVVIGSTDGAVERDIDLANKTTIHQTAAVLALCERLITLDSLPLHLAQAVECPVVGLFGATHPDYIVTDYTTAIGITADGSKASCAGERHRTVGSVMVPCNGECMKTITPQRVIDVLQNLLP